jgi:hypothetical protein
LLNILNIYYCMTTKGKWWGQVAEWKFVLVLIMLVGEVGKVTTLFCTHTVPLNTVTNFVTTGELCKTVHTKFCLVFWSTKLGTI